MRGRILVLLTVPVMIRTPPYRSLRGILERLRPARETPIPELELISQMFLESPARIPRIPLVWTPMAMRPTTIP